MASTRKARPLCGVRECAQRVQPGMVLCPPHWRLLPRALQEEVIRERAHPMARDPDSSAPARALRYIEGFKRLRALHIDALIARRFLIKRRAYFGHRAPIELMRSSVQWARVLEYIAAHPEPGAYSDEPPSAAR